MSIAILNSSLYAILILQFILQLPVNSVYAQNLIKYEFSEVHMGTLFRIVLYTESSEKAEAASRHAFDRVKELNKVFSDYLEDSELSQISENAFNKELSVSDDMWHLLNLSDDFYQKSNGSFNAAMGPLTKLWRRAIRRQEMPEKSAILQALKYSHWEDVILNKKAKTVLLKKEKMRLDMGGIAKGFAIDEAYKTLVQHGISIALVDGGGDIMAGDPPPHQKAWHIKLTRDEHVEDHFMSNEAIASSGAKYKSIEHQGKIFSHIIDPFTGYGISAPKTVNVNAKSCVLADAAATALSVINGLETSSILKLQFDIQVLD